MPSISVAWTSSQDIPNNRSTVTATVKLTEPYNVNFGANKKGSITVNGVTKNFTTTASYKGPGTWNIATLSFTVPHNSDGGKSFSFSAWYDINITYSGSWLGRISTSGSGTLPTIPRASSIASIAGNLIGSPVTVNISRASASFTHEVIYDFPDGSRRNLWSGIGTTHTFTPAASDAQFLTNGTSGKAKITLRTFSGSTMIGSTTKFFTLNVPNTAAYNPTINSIAVGVAGSGRDKTIGKFVQNISKAAISFTRTTKYGAKIKSESINVKRKADGKDNRTYTGSSATTALLAMSGVYLITVNLTDTRGRSTSTTREITVEAYAAPSINEFKVRRKDGTATVVTTSFKAVFSNLGTSNPASVTMSRTPVGGTQTTVKTFPNRTTAYNELFDIAGNSDTQSYDFKITITDSFGNKASATGSVSTGKVALSLKGTQGIGVGKIHEDGALDVTGRVRIQDDGGIIHLRSPAETGHGWIGWFKAGGDRVGYVGIPAADSINFHINNEQGGQISMFGNRLLFNSMDVATSGSNGNGKWVRFYDGTLICYHVMKTASAIDKKFYNDFTYRSDNTYWTFPMAFYGPGRPSFFTNEVGGVGQTWTGLGENTATNTGASFMAFTARKTGQPEVALMAIGRWY